MRELTKKELHQQLTDDFVKDQFSSYLIKHPGDRSAAALYVASRLQVLLLAVMGELPHNEYNTTIQKLKG
jgi:hypothetical protein